MTMLISRPPDKVNGNVYYYDAEHVYIDKDTQAKHTSVTTLIHQYTHEFDSAFWSAYKAMESLMVPSEFAILKKTLLASKRFNPIFVRKFGIDEEVFANKCKEILAGYDEERDKSCERGTKIHAEFEQSFYKSQKQDLSKFGLAGEYICRPNNYELDLEKGVYPEYLVSRTSADGVLRVAGQIDLLVKDGNDIYIFDYKTNKEIKQKSYYNKAKKAHECMKFPLNNIMDTNFWHYTLQLSLYAYLLQQINPEFNIKMLRIIHVDHNNVTTEYDLEYRKDDVQRMLQHYKKQMKIQSDLDKIKPINY